MLRRIEQRLLNLLLRRAERRGDAPPPPEPDLMSRRDALTRLLNRTAFIEDVRRACEAGAAGALLVIDVDHFKRVNDEHGHSAGDEVLRALAHRSHGMLPPESLLGRLGGDEFVAFVHGAQPEVFKFAERIRIAATAPIACAPLVEVHVTLSIGMASLGASGSPDQTLIAADQAVFAAKHAGRNRVQVFDDDTTSVVGARRSLAASLATMQERNRELQQRVEIDALTGLLNRHALDGVLATTCGGADAEWPNCSVAFIDVDHFGSYNKHQGDTQGDEALRQVARAVRAVARKNDLVFRKGGEELVVVLRDASAEAANAGAERMRHAVEALAIPHAGSPVAHVLTVTVGIASAVADTPASVQLLMDKAAWMAMKAKLADRRNRVHVAQVA